jgi:hypothetical protein
MSVTIWRGIGGSHRLTVVSFSCLLTILGVIGTERAQPPTEPIAAILQPADNSTVSGRTRVVGWAVDPQQPPNSGQGINARDVQLWLGPFPDGRLLDFAQYGLPSEDAPQRHGASFLNSGFQRTWETCSFRPGRYDLWVYVSSLASPGARGYSRVGLTVEPCRQGSELYRADFENHAAWRTITTTQVATRPDGGAWIIERKAPGASGESPEGVFADFRVEIKARLLSRVLNRYYYLQFRQVPGPGDSLTDTYYRFTVDPDYSSFDLARWEGERETALLPETRLGDLINPPAEENQLAVEAVGPRIRVYINGVQVGEANDDTLPWGRISFGVGTGGQTDAQARFRDFVIATP